LLLRDFSYWRKKEFLNYQKGNDKVFWDNKNSLLCDSLVFDFFYIYVFERVFSLLFMFLFFFYVQVDFYVPSDVKRRLKKQNKFGNETLLNFQVRVDLSEIWSQQRKRSSLFLKSKRNCIICLLGCSFFNSPFFTNFPLERMRLSQSTDHRW
jgi:hypothetical protein